MVLSPVTPISQARELMMKGCEMCPNNEDVWLEAARLQVRLAVRLLSCCRLGRALYA